MSAPNCDASELLPVSRTSTGDRKAYPQLLSASQTRVVHLQLGSQNAPFEASLEVIDLDLTIRPSFYAISYHCGDLTPVSEVYLADVGIKLPIAGNLTDALTRVLNDRVPGPYWIDQISIKQDNVEELTQQVRLMTRIFTAANQVLMWLGRDDGTVPDAVRLLCKWGNPYRDIAVSGEMFEHFSNNSHLFDTAAYEILRRLAEEMCEEDWAVLNAFFNRQYFRRAWVVQEVCVGRELQVLCGSFPSFGIGVLSLSAYWLAQHASNRTREDGHYGTALAMRTCVMNSLKVVVLCGMRFKWQKTGAIPMSQFLKTCFNKSYDTRDKFFALQGIFNIPAAIQDYFKIDYSRPTWLVCAEAVKGIIKATKSLHVLTIRNSRPNSDAAFPSWVPPFTSDPDQFGWDAEVKAWELGADPTKSIPHSAPGTEVGLREDRGDRTLSLLGIRYPYTIAGAFPLSPEGWDPTVPDGIRSYEWVQWRAALVYMSLRRFPYRVSKRRSIATAFAECTTMRYRSRMDLQRYSDNKELIFADFRAYLRAWTDEILSRPGAKPMHDQVAELSAELATWDEEDHAGGATGQLDDDADQQGRPKGDMYRYYTSMAIVCLNRSLFITRDWNFGVGPDKLEKGDSLACFFGAARPFVVRKQEPDGQWMLVGHTWMNGLMDGQILKSHGKEDEWFDLI